eukprot:11541649-Heterocapsa_arctica.AAC.1
MHKFRAASRNLVMECAFVAWASCRTRVFVPGDACEEYEWQGGATPTGWVGQLRSAALVPNFKYLWRAEAMAFSAVVKLHNM